MTLTGSPPRSPPTLDRPLRLLLLTPRPEDAGAVGALDRLPHTVERVGLDLDRVDDPDAYDVIVVDASGDLRSSADACRAARSVASGVPIVLVIASGHLAAVNGSWGFDDWVLPEGSPAELAARLRVVTERSEAAAERKLTVGRLVIDEDAYDARLAGTALDLTPTEFELLRTLAANAGRVMTREALLDHAWGYEFYGGIRTVDVHIRRVRAKLGPEHERMIVTVRGVGYKLVARPGAGDR